jgi:hypothetical protein
MGPTPYLLFAVIGIPEYDGNRILKSRERRPLTSSLRLLPAVECQKKLEASNDSKATLKAVSALLSTTIAAIRIHL